MGYGVLYDKRVCCEAFSSQKIDFVVQRVIYSNSIIIILLQIGRHLALTTSNLRLFSMHGFFKYINYDL